MEEDDDYGDDAAGAGADDPVAELLSRFSGITTTDTEELVRKWSEIMQVPLDEADFFLAAASYNLEIAVNFYLEAHTRERIAAAAPPPASAFPPAVGQGVGYPAAMFGASPFTQPAFPGAARFSAPSPKLDGERDFEDDDDFGEDAEDAELQAALAKSLAESGAPPSTADAAAAAAAAAGAWSGIPALIPVVAPGFVAASSAGGSAPAMAGSFAHESLSGAAPARPGGGMEE